MLGLSLASSLLHEYKEYHPHNFMTILYASGNTPKLCSFSSSSTSLRMLCHSHEAAPRRAFAVCLHVRGRLLSSKSSYTKQASSKCCQYRQCLVPDSNGMHMLTGSTVLSRLLIIPDCKRRSWFQARAGARMISGSNREIESFNLEP